MPVLVDDWQMDCCGTRPVLGARVSWTLNWTPWYAERVPTAMRLRARLEPGRFSWTCENPEVVPAIARVGGVSVYVPAPAPLAEEIVLTGVLHEDHHDGAPPETPLTTGLITALRRLEHATLVDLDVLLSD
ncbi:hypothetical protein KALB_3336 [Kutzneria albida DSM 43870]|uniref:Uncharacterized protein n=1 Tax=Kutzneria albida DSM 43870 TaxID=1449976 RepID=W5W677_9PSEU|nr:hypothetical protein KALB_3336 [Kutzneria albida DSM 43870]